MDNIEGIAARYELDWPGVELGGGNIFRARPDRPWSPRFLLCSVYRVSFLGVIRPVRSWPSTPSNIEVKENV